MNHNTYRKIISGRDHRFGVGALRVLLGATAVVYGMVVRLRNRLFNIGILRSYAVGVPVISIGNITTGGTGKTPLVMWVCNYLADKNIACAVLTRGYKAGSGKLTDEPAILAKGCRNTNVIVNPCRVDGAKKAIEEFKSDVIVMDDGFQHRALGRDVNIITLDATCPFGYDRLLPAGLLREPISAIKRADAIVITRYNQAGPERNSVIEEKIRKIKPGIEIAKAVHKPIRAVLMKNAELSIDELREKKIYAFCGIGNPQAFIDMLAELKLEVAGSRVYNDHHKYSQQDMRDIYEEAEYLDAGVILSTQKDWVKTALLTMEKEHILFAYLAIELEFIEGQENITKLIDGCINDE